MGFSQVNFNVFMYIDFFCIIIYQIRIMISDFAVFSAIIIMVAIDYLVGLSTPKLQVPEEFRVSGRQQ